MSFTPKYFPYLEPTKTLGGRERADKILEQLPLHPEDALYLYHELAFVCFPGVDHPLCEKACDYIIQHGDPEMVFNGCWLKSSLSDIDPKRMDETIKLLEKCVELQPDHEVAHEHLGNAYMKRFRYDDAIKHYLINIEITEKEGDECDWHYEEIAQAYFGKQEYDTAEKYFQKALVLNAENIDAILGMGRVRASQEKYDEAMKYFDQALELEPENAYIFYYKGLVWGKKDDFYRAMHFYTEALKLEPDFPEVYNNIGALYHDKEGNVKEAVAQMMKGIELIKDKDDRFLSTLYLNISKLYKQMADFEMSEHYHNLFLQSLGFPTELDEGDEEGEEGEEDNDDPRV